MANRFSAFTPRERDTLLEALKSHLDVVETFLADAEDGDDVRTAREDERNIVAFIDELETAQ